MFIYTVYIPSSAARSVLRPAFLELRENMRNPRNMGNFFFGALDCSKIGRQWADIAFLYMGRYSGMVNSAGRYLYMAGAPAGAQNMPRRPIIKACPGAAAALVRARTLIV